MNCVPAALEPFRAAIVGAWHMSAEEVQRDKIAQSCLSGCRPRMKKPQESSKSAWRRRGAPFKKGAAEEAKAAKALNLQSHRIRAPPPKPLLAGEKGEEAAREQEEQGRPQNHDARVAERKRGGSQLARLSLFAGRRSCKRSATRPSQHASVWFSATTEGSLSSKDNERAGKHERREMCRHSNLGAVVHNLDWGGCLPERCPNDF